MVKNMKQVNKLLENVNKEMNAAELAKVMEKFEQVSFRLNQLKIFFYRILFLGIRRLRC
jgi:division protein CdvB (Snf7/Vps24/ESCRT-III family)